MVSLTHPDALAGAHRFQSWVGVRRIRSFFTYSYCRRGTASALRPFPIPVHARLCRGDPRDNGVWLGDRRPAWWRARRLSRSQTVDDSDDRGLFRIDGLERAFLGLVVFCYVSLPCWARNWLR